MLNELLSVVTAVNSGLNVLHTENPHEPFDHKDVECLVVNYQDLALVIFNHLMILLF